MIWLVFLANMLSAPVHAVRMLEPSAAPVVSEECPMHQPHRVSGDDENCVCPGGNCSVSGADRPLSIVASVSLDSSERPNEWFAADADGLPEKSVVVAYSSRGPPLFSLY